MVKIKKIALLTSGGDAPGMNAAIRAVVRYSCYHDVKVYGVMRGYKGLIDNEMDELGPGSVSNILQRGGTILKTSRCDEFKRKNGQRKAKFCLEQNSIDALIVIGGDGSFRGAHELGKIWKGRIIGVPGTIDNDLYGTDYTIGFDTAVNTALEGIDKVRDTADAHERFFLIEVMGRHAGFIALEVGIAGGAEDILLPGRQVPIKNICRRLHDDTKRQKTSNILIVAEGYKEGGAYAIAKKLEAKSGKKYHVVVLGYLQRGGTPTALDRRLATELGAFSVHQILKGKSGVMVGKDKGRLAITPLPETWKRKKTLDTFLQGLVPILRI